MLKKEDFVVIKVLTEHGVYQKDIAEKLGVHPKTVSRALKRGSTAVKVRKVKSSKLEPYKPMIDRLLSEGVWNAVVILREIQVEGYKGEISLVRKYIQPKRVSALRSLLSVALSSVPANTFYTGWQP